MEQGDLEPPRATPADVVDDVTAQPHVVVREHAGERVVLVSGRLFVGRECSGVDPDRRLIIEDEEVSRDHLEIRADSEGRRVSLIDTSSNGTRLNGARVERGAPARLSDGDRIRLGSTELEFHVSEFRRTTGGFDPRATTRPVRAVRMGMVVGDILNYSALSENADSALLSATIGRLFGELRILLTHHRGTIGNYAGDALFALWEVDHFADVSNRALRYALAARELVLALAPDLSLKDLDGEPLRMGWGVAEGDASTTSIGGASSVLGDAANLAFRLSSLAGRDGRPEILATRTALDAVTIPLETDPGTEMTFKGRAGTEVVCGVLGQVRE